jgi:hypothetical protein
MTVAAPAVFNLHDSKKFREAPNADPSISFTSEDDYQITRPRHTRRPRRAFTIGFTFITDAEKKLIEQLYNDARGGSEIITGWVHPVDKVEVLVRFKSGTPPSYNYKGAGETYRWDIENITLVEV